MRTLDPPKPARIVATAIVVMTLAGITFAQAVPTGDERSPSPTAKSGSIPPGAAGEASTADGAGAPSAGDDTVRGEHPETYLDFAIAGGYLMIPIGLCSILLVAFLIERLISTRRSRVLPSPFVTAVQELTRNGAGGAGRAGAICDAHPSAAARIVRVAADTIRRPRDELEDAVNVAARREVFFLRRYTRLFVVIASVAPLLGLLGTVTGMIQAFREVAIQGLGSGQALAPGIYQALITTAAGLLVAIPAMIAYHWIMSRVDNYTHAIDNLVVDFVDANRPESEAAS